MTRKTNVYILVTNLLTIVAATPPSEPIINNKIFLLGMLLGFVWTWLRSDKVYKSLKGRQLTFGMIGSVIGVQIVCMVVSTLLGSGEFGFGVYIGSFAGYYVWTLYRQAHPYVPYNDSSVNSTTTH